MPPVPCHSEHQLGWEEDSGSLAHAAPTFSSLTQVGKVCGSLSQRQTPSPRYGGVSIKNNTAESFSPVGRHMGSGREGIVCLEGSASVRLSSKLLLTPCHSWSPALDHWRACALLGGSPLVPAICWAAVEGLWPLKQSSVFLEDGMTPTVSYGDKGMNTTHVTYMSICGSLTVLRNPFPEILQGSGSSLLRIPV